MFFSIILLTFLQILHSEIPSPGKLVKTRHIWRHDLQTVNWVTTFIGDSCSRCERVDNSTSSWVELCRYKRALRFTHVHIIRCQSSHWPGKLGRIRENLETSLGGHGKIACARPIRLSRCCCNYCFRSEAWQRERLSASELCICLSVCLSVAKLQRNAIF